jgi:hypothetical protein
MGATADQQEAALLEAYEAKLQGAVHEKAIKRAAQGMLRARINALVGQGKTREEAVQLLYDDACTQAPTATPSEGSKMDVVGTIHVQRGLLPLRYETLLFTGEKTFVLQRGQIGWKEGLFAPLSVPYTQYKVHREGEGFEAVDEAQIRNLLIQDRNNFVMENSSIRAVELRQAFGNRLKLRIATGAKTYEWTCDLIPGNQTVLVDLYAEILRSIFHERFSH